jgi:D-alanyl-D-alanine carboxypeptidase
MTMYVTLQAVRDKRITLDSLFTVTARAATQAPSKIGFKPGTQVTVDNLLKILMVKSANDVAVMLAEGVSGSVENFADEMTTTSRKLGMTQSNWVNPNGLPADEQISSARDLAMLGRALIRDFPEYELYWHIPAIQLGKKYMRNYNTLIGRYEGADGMKTGFICASGFNLVASATRNGKRLIAVVLGSPSSPYRAAKAAGLLERGFHRGPLSWLSPSLGTVESLQPVNVAPPDMREEMCGPHRKRPAAEEADDESADTGLLSNLPPSAGKPSTLLKDTPGPLQTITVFIGAAKNAAEAQFAAARAKIAKIRAKKDTASGQAAAKGGNAAKPAAATATDATATTTPQPARAARSMPSPIDLGKVMSYTAPAKTGPEPLTAVPGAKPDARPHTKPAAKPAVAAAAKPAVTAAAAPKPKAKTKPKPEAAAEKPKAAAEKPKIAADKRAATTAPKQQ